MDKVTLLSYISETQGIEFVSNLLPDSIGGPESPLFLCECRLTVDAIKIPVKLLITEQFPRSLPHFFLEKYDALGFLPHIEPKGNICFLEKESVFINEEEPRAVFEASVDLAIQTLSDGLAGRNFGDFREEFHVFWERNQFVSDLPLLSFIEVTEEPKRISVVKDAARAMVFDLESADLQKQIHFTEGTGLAKSGIYIPLRLDCEMIPPKYTHKWTAVEFSDWLLPKVSELHLNFLRDSMGNEVQREFEFLLLGVPRESGATILVAVHFEPNEGSSHPLLNSNSDWEIDLHRVKRLDKAAFLPRGGASIELQSKSVLLVGCGSVGSHLAIELAKAGIGQIHIVDHDKLEMENVQRFALGFHYVGDFKVHAVGMFLTSNYPFTNVTVSAESFETFYRTNAEKLTAYDLIVSATGDPTTNLHLNKQTRGSNIPFLVGWNEPLGIGGHAVISSSDHIGCYRCLFRNQYNFASFAAKEQSKPFHVRHLGCGEAFTPYSALDSVRTSELMARMTIAFITSRDRLPQVLSWKGDKTTFEQQGFNVSSRYSQSQDELNRNRYSFILNECPHCSIEL